MAMENYSPSHPTDEVDLDHSPQVVTADLKESKEKPNLSTKSDRKSYSKSPEKKSNYKARSRSRSRKRRSRSRSKNRRSRSRNRSDKSYNKSRDYDSRSIDRRSHSRDRRSRSKDRKPRSNEKRSRSKDRRSRSRESKRYHNRDSRSPYRQRDSRSNSQRKTENNIFSKLSELSGSKVREEPVKSKWTYDSDEETQPTATSATTNDSGFTDPANRFDDVKPYHRKPDYNNDSSFSDRNDDQKPYPRRQEFNNNRRGGGNFNRNRQWEPRNARNNNFRNFNNRNNFSSGSSGFSNENWKQPEPLQKQAPWTEDDDDQPDTKTVSNDTREVIIASVSPIAEETSSKPFESSPVTKPDRSGFAVDSDEEYGSWNKSDRNETNRNQSDNNRNFGDNNRSFTDNTRDSGDFNRSRNNNFDLGDSNLELGNQRSINDMLTIANLESKSVSDNQVTEHCLSAAESPRPVVPAPPVGTAVDSDEEDFGAWNSEQKTTKQAVVSTEDSSEPRGNKWGQERDNDDEDFGSWGAANRDRDQSAPGAFEQHPQQFYPQGNNYQQQPRSNFYGRNNDNNNQRYPMNNNYQNNRRGGGNFNRFQRPGMPMNNNNNMNNSGNGNQYHPHQQQQYQQQPDRFGAGNYGPGNRSNNSDMMNMKMPPPTMFNPSQRPPHWSMGNTASAPGFPGGMCNGPLATGPMQFPMGNSGTGNASMAAGMMGGSGSMMAPPPQMQFPPQLGHPMGGHGHGGPMATGMSLPNLMQSMQQQQQHSYIPPPPPATQPMQSMQQQTQQHGIHGYGQQQQQQTVPSDSNNLLEAIMTNVGLSSKSMELYKSSSSSSNSSSMLPGATTTSGNISGQSAPPGNSNRQQSTVSDSLSSIIKSAASTVLSRLALESASAHRNTAASSAVATASSAATGNISDSMSMSPPSPACSPPPPIRHQQHSVSTGNNNGSSSEPLFVLPPLPNYNDIIKPTSLLMSTAHKPYSSGTVGIPATAASSLPPSVSSYSNAMTAAVMPGHLHQQQSSSASEISEEKRNRSDFDSKSDWQERIALEVKNFLRPAYMGKKINKADYKEIMKRCVTKISRSGVTEINTEKIEKFVLSYVDKYQKFRRGKQHGVVSSSEHELVM